MLDLLVAFSDVDFALTAQSMLDGTESPEYFTIGSTCLVAPEAIPVRLLALAVQIVNKAGCWLIQRPDTLHRDFPMFSISLRRLISMSALSSAGSRGDSPSRSRRSLIALEDSPFPSATRSV